MSETTLSINITNPLLEDVEVNPNPWDMSLINIPKVKLEDDEIRLIQQKDIARKLIYPDPRPLDLFSVPSECPIGLEPLWLANTTLIVLRRPENAILLRHDHRLLAFSQYDIVNERGRQLYVAVEKTTPDSLRWMRDARMFEVNLYDRESRRILTIKRPLTCRFCCAQYYCCLCMFAFKGCGNDAVVTLCEGNKKLGLVRQLCSLDRTTLDIYDDADRHILTISGKLMDGIFDIHLAEDDEDPIAMIETSMTAPEVSAFYKIKVSRFEDPYGVTFLSKRLPAKYKALIISAIILMDFIFLKPNTDYLHWTQFIPTDFKPDPETREKVFRDGSKEVIVTSMKPKDYSKNVTEQGRCACCRWFFGFVCLFCPLGFKRNALRCIQLIILGILLFVLAVLAISLPNRRK